MNPRHTTRGGQPPPATLVGSLDRVAVTAHRVMRLRSDSRTYRGCASFPETLVQPTVRSGHPEGCPTGMLSRASAQRGCRLHAAVHRSEW